MSNLEATLAALREAVRLAPDNVPLLRHYVSTLTDLTRYDEARTFGFGQSTSMAVTVAAAA